MNHHRIAVIDLPRLQGISPAWQSTAIDPARIPGTLTYAAPLPVSCPTPQGTISGPVQPPTSKRDLHWVEVIGAIASGIFIWDYLTHRK